MSVVVLSQRSSRRCAVCLVLCDKEEIGSETTTCKDRLVEPI